MAQRNVSLTKKSGLLHIEAPGCIVNIKCGLTDWDGREVVNVSISANGNRYSGDPEWWINGEHGNSGVAVRVVCTGYKQAAD